MALAFGCGLTSGEVAAVRTGHLRRLDSGATVATVPGTERLIFCRTACGNIPPAEYEAIHCRRQQATLTATETK
ncbi:hypothetical protein ACIBF6_40300 [Streptosporangium amethystogenes]|uniref:hypothetical protein n=1 Tax=Streptosporangium amethystogenes TaxID=2002 RepID=UPI0037B146EB